MTLVHNSTDGKVEVTSAEVHYTAMPHWEDDALANYTGYFHCDGKSRKPILTLDYTADFV